MKWLLIGCIAGFLFGIVLNLPKLIGLGLPVLYSLVIVWVPGWSTAHPVLSNGIFYGLIGFNVLLWLIALGQTVYGRIVQRRVERMADFAIWQEAFGAKENWTLITYPGLTHCFTPGLKSEGANVYARPEKVDAAVIQDIADFVTAR